MRVMRGLGVYHKTFLSSLNCLSALGTLHSTHVSHHANCLQCTEVRFASFLSAGFTSMAVINPPEKKLAKRTSVQ